MRLFGHTGQLSFLMGVYELSNQTTATGSPLYINHDTGSATNPKSFLFRASTDLKWRVTNDESGLAENKGYLRSDQADADVPTVPDLTWFQGESMLVAEVRPLLHGHAIHGHGPWLTRVGAVHGLAMQ